jgi:hypothetical protein
MESGGLGYWSAVMSKLSFHALTSWLRAIVQQGRDSLAPPELPDAGPRPAAITYFSASESPSAADPAPESRPPRSSKR